jgi:hypothetical protein
MGLSNNLAVLSSRNFFKGRGIQESNREEVQPENPCYIYMSNRFSTKNKKYEKLIFRPSFNPTGNFVFMFHK